MQVKNGKKEQQQLDRFIQQLIVSDRFIQRQTAFALSFCFV